MVKKIIDVDAVVKELADIKEAHEATMNEVCEGTDDRKHCTCVPFLRAEIEALKQSQGKCESDGLMYTSNPPQQRCKNCGTFWRGETPTCKSQGKVLSVEEMAKIVIPMVCGIHGNDCGVRDCSFNDEWTQDIITAIHNKMMEGNE